MKEIGGRICSISCDLKIQSVLTPFPKKFVYFFSNAWSEQNIELKKKHIFIPVPFIQLADLLTVKNGICIRICQNTEIYTHTLCGQNAEFFTVPPGGRPTYKKMHFEGCICTFLFLCHGSQFCYSYQARHWRMGLGLRIHYPLVKVQ